MQSPLVNLRTIALFGLLNLVAAIPALSQTVNVVGFGDSLMAGYQLSNTDAFPIKLENALKERGYDVRVQNAGVSGDTTSGGLARLNWSVPDGTDLVLLALGGNDALRGITPDITRTNLNQMIESLQARDIGIILVGILAPPNMGDTYAATFNPIFSDLAQTHALTFYPFFLEGVITNPELLLADGIHPNGAGTKVMVENFLPLITQYLDEMPNTRQ
ncbi:MAG: arylesterase [Pseudomonadota bacterium]